MSKHIPSKLERAFQRLRNDSSCRSLLRSYLTKHVFGNLAHKTGPDGCSLLDVIRSGSINLDSAIGVYSPNAASYDLFSELLTPIIEDYHGFSSTDEQPMTDFGDSESLTNLDPNNEFVISTRVRCCRSLADYPFFPLMTKSHLRNIEQNVRNVLEELQGELSGVYHPISGIDRAEQEELARNHLLFEADDRFLRAGNAYSHWPTGRGIFCNQARTFAVWVNEEDHLRIMSIQKGADMRETYGRLVRALRALDGKVAFSRHERLGYLTSCPTNLGTTIRASVLIRLPKLGSDEIKLKALASAYNLQLRGTHGEHSKSENGIYDVSNRTRLGATEIEVMRGMQTGILRLIEHEKGIR